MGRWARLSSARLACVLFVSGRFVVALLYTQMFVLAPPALSFRCGPFRGV